MRTSFGTNIVEAQRKRVYYEGINIIREGMPVCYNYDTTTNVLRYDKGAGGVPGCQTSPNTTAEGNQNEGKFLLVEDPATANFQWLAGVVAGTSFAGQTGPRWLEIYVANGAIVPVRTNKNCTIGDSLGISDATQHLAAVTGDGDPLACALCEETVDRSNATGIVLAKLFPTGMQISATGAHFAPVRSSATSGREYGVKIDGDNFFIGTTAAQSYLLEVSGDKVTVSTGDAYSALIHVSGSNYAANDTNYTYRGINCAITNRSGGTLGQIYGANVSISLKSGSGDITNAIAMQIDAQDLTSGTKTNFGGLDIAVNREGVAATEEFGVRVRTRGTINTAMNTVFRIDKDATDHGFINLFNIESDAVDYQACTGDVTVDTSDKVIPIVLGGTTYYLIAVDSIP